MQPLQKGCGLARGEIADAGTGEEHQRVLAGKIIRQVQLVGKVGTGRVHLQPGIVGGQALGAAEQEVFRDVDAQVAGWVQRLQQQAYLAARAAAQFDQVAVGTGDVEDVVGRVGENLFFGAGDVVLGLLADLFEQLGTAAIVEELR